MSAIVPSAPPALPVPSIPVPLLAAPTVPPLLLPAAAAPMLLPAAPPHAAAAVGAPAGGAQWGAWEGWEVELLRDGEDDDPGFILALPGLVLKDVKDGSPAGRAQLAVALGWSLVKVNGVSVKGLEDLPTDWWANGGGVGVRLTWKPGAAAGHADDGRACTNAPNCAAHATRNGQRATRGDCRLSPPHTRPNTKEAQEQEEKEEEEEHAQGRREQARAEQQHAETGKIKEEEPAPAPQRSRSRSSSRSGSASSSTKKRVKSKKGKEKKRGREKEKKAGRRRKRDQEP
eukprot:gene45520-46532_t